MCADISRSIEIIFGAVDNTGGGISSVANSLNSVVDKASNITEPLSNVAVYAAKAEAAVLALAAAYGTYASVKAAEFENAQIDLNKVLSDGDPAIGSFTDTVMQLSETYGVASTSILQGIANFKQAGFTAKESADLQKTALDLVIAGDVEAARASEILVSSLKGFNAPASDAARFIEALNNVSNDYATDVNQLAEGMSRVAPILKIMGFSFEEGTGLLTPMIEVFRDGSVAADALKTGLIKLVDDSKPVTTALAALGVSQFDLNGKMRSGKDIFYDVANAFTTLDQNQKLVFAGQLFGIEQAPKLVTVFDNIAKVNAVTAAAMEHTGSVAKEVDLRLASMSKTIDILKVSFDNLATSIGKQINEQLGGLASSSSNVLQAFRDIVDKGGLDVFFNALRPQVEAFAQTLNNIATNLPAAFAEVDFSGLIAALKDLGFEFGGLFDGLDLNTVEGLTKAIQFAADSFESLTWFVSGIVEQWDTVVEKFTQWLGEFNKTSDASKKFEGNISGLANIFETFKGVLTSGADILKTFGLALTAIAGIDVAKGFLSMVPAVESLATTIVTKFGPGGAAFAALAAIGFGIERNIAAWDDYKNRQNLVAESTTHLNAEQDKIKVKLAEISQSTGVTVGSMDDLNKAIEQGRIVFDAATGAYSAAGSGVRDYDAEVQAATKGTFDFAAVVNAHAETLKMSNEVVVKSTEGFNTLEDAQAAVVEGWAHGKTATIEFKDGLYQLQQTNIGVADATDKVADATQKAAATAKAGSEEWKRVQDVMLETQKQTDDFNIKMGELANKRYEIDVKANVDLKVAEIEADTARITAAFQASSEVIGTLAKASTDLWSTFSGAAHGLKALDIEAAALRMENRLDEELLLKREMNDAIIAKMQAETARLVSGEPLISIDARELAPELELVFDKILKYTQVKATQQGLSLLVGIS